MGNNVTIGGGMSKLGPDSGRGLPRDVVDWVNSQSIATTTAANSRAIRRLTFCGILLIAAISVAIAMAAGVVVLWILVAALFLTSIVHLLLKQRAFHRRLAAE